MNKIHSLVTASLFAASVGGLMAAPALAANNDTTPTTKIENGQSPAKVTANADNGAVASDKAAATRAAIAPKVATIGAPKTPQHTMVSRERVEHIQTALADSGAKIAIDGIWGPKTTDALKDFQRAHDLTVTGHLDHETLSALPKAT